jgi:hypothetical protein
MQFKPAFLSGLLCPVALITNCWIILLPDDSEYRRLVLCLAMYLAFPGEPRGCSTNTSVTDLFIN